MEHYNEGEKGASNDHAIAAATPIYSQHQAHTYRRDARKHQKSKLSANDTIEPLRMTHGSNSVLLVYAMDAAKQQQAEHSNEPSAH